MAEKRMFAKSIVLSDAFLDMPMSARCLYFTLSMLADDDGFVGNPKSIMRQCGASQDDLAILIGKRFALAFESGVIVIKHWRINNYLRIDRHTPTNYRDEMATLAIDENGAYTEQEKGLVYQRYTTGIPTCNPDKIRLDKSSVEESSIEEDREEINNISSTRQANLSDTTLLVTRESKPPISLYLADGSATSPESGEIERLKAAFPSVDIEAEFYKAAEWLRANPDKRPTIDRMSAFIFGWMRNAQKDEKNPPPARTGQKPKADPYKPDADVVRAAWKRLQEEDLE